MRFVDVMTNKQHVPGLAPRQHSYVATAPTSRRRCDLKNARNRVLVNGHAMIGPDPWLGPAARHPAPEPRRVPLPSQAYPPPSPRHVVTTYRCRIHHEPQRKSSRRLPRRASSATIVPSSPGNVTSGSRWWPIMKGTKTARGGLLCSVISRATVTETVGMPRRSKARCTSATD